MYYKSKSLINQASLNGVLFVVHSNRSLGSFNFKTMEIWKDVSGYEGLYQVSNLGRVKSVARKVWNKGSNCFVYYKERILKPSNARGYLRQPLSKKGVVKTFSLAVLVAIAFLNHRPCGHKIVVDHVDNNSLNNRLENLQLISQRQNVSKDKFRGNYSSNYVGVSWNILLNKWRAMIKINGNSKSLGCFNDEKEASIAYQKALKKHEAN